MGGRISGIGVVGVAAGAWLGLAAPWARALPTYASCATCHPQDPKTTIAVKAASQAGNNVTYDISGTTQYTGGKKGWGVFNSASENIANGLGAGKFTLPADGQTYRVFWVDKATDDANAPNPNLGGSPSADVTTPAPRNEASNAAAGSTIKAAGSATTTATRPPAPNAAR